MLKDSEIIKNIIEDKKAECFGTLYDRYSNKVYNKCISLIKDLEIAKDLTHDIFLKVFVNLGSFKGDSTFSTWLYSITYNYCMDYLRKSKKFIEVAVNEKLPDFQTSDEQDEVDSIYQMDSNKLNALLEKIPTNDKVILLMKYQDDMSIKEIKQSFNIGESAAKMRLKRAKEKLIFIYNDKYKHNISTL